MKADKFGTAVEQRRFKMGWIRRAVAPEPPKCKNCQHVEEKWRDRLPRDTVTYRCTKGEFATTPGGKCNHHAPKES